MFEVIRLFCKCIYYTPLIIIGYKTLPDLIHSLGVFYVKLAQIATTRPDILSEFLIRKLVSLQDHVPVGKDVPKEGLIASGSIALIYEISNSQIMKVKRLEIEKEIKNGALLLTSLFKSRIGAYLSKKSSWFHNISKLENLISVKLPQHLDFKQETINQRRISCLMEPELVIPKVYFSTENEIIMEKIHGVKLSELSELSDALNIELAITSLLNIVWNMIFVHRLIHGDLHEGNILVTHDGKISLLDFAVITEISEDNVKNLCIFFLSCITKSSSVLCKTMTRGKTNKKFEADMKFVFEKYEITDMYTFLNHIIQISLRNHIQLEESLLDPIIFMIQAEGIAKKYSNQSLMKKVLTNLYKINHLSL